MPRPGFARSRPKSSARALAALLGMPLLAPIAAEAQAVPPFAVAGDAIARPLGGRVGDAARGRQVVVDRQAGNCLLCHTGPFPEERLHGTVGPDLRGVGSRLTAGQIRLRIVDSRRLDPDSIMPAYHAVAGLNRVGAAWRGRPILDAQQVEDAVAFLSSLRDPP